MKIKDIKIFEKNIPKSKELDEIVKLMQANGIKDPIDLLPSGWHEVHFHISDTYAGFANAIRRVLIDELPVYALDINEEMFETDDDFILSDLLKKNINLIPINQETAENYIKHDIYLYKFNDTNDIIDIKASDIKVKEKDKKSKKEVSNNLIPNSNITIIRLRPGKFIRLNSLNIVNGFCKDDAGKFSLLNNVQYKPTDMIPYDVFSGKGTRSIDYDPKEFDLSFTTCGNIKPMTVIKLTCDVLINKLTQCKKLLTEYINSTKSDTKKYYFTDGLEVQQQSSITYYKFIGEYITISYMLAQRCFILDNNILYCVPAIDRYDNEIAIIKLKHSEPDKLLLKAIDLCVEDVSAIQKQFSSK